MALNESTHLSGATSKALARPYKSSAGTVYVLGPGGTNVLRAQWNTNPSTTSWNVSNVADVTLTGAAGNDLMGMDAVQDGDTLYVVTYSKQSDFGDATGGYVLYHVFDMSSNTWTTSNESVKSNFNTGDTSTEMPYPVSIARRSDGDLIVLYQGAKAAVMGTDYRRVVYARREAGVWTIDVAVDPASGEVNYLPVQVLMGGSDRAHLFYMSFTNSQLFHKSLTSTNTLNAADNVTGTSTANNSFTPAIAGAVYSSGGTTKAFISWPLSTDASQLNAASFDSADTPTFSTAVDALGSFSLGASDRQIRSFAVDGTTIWGNFSQFSTKNLYYSSRTDGGSWAAATLQRTAVAETITNNVFTRGGNRVLAVCYYIDDANDKIWYDEYTISAGTTSTTGSMSATDVADKFTAVGYTIVQSRLSATDAQDRFTAPTQVIVRASMAATEAPDIFSASGTSYAAFVSAAMSATDAPDIFSASANVRVAASLNVTDAPDRLSASGYVVVSSRLSATDAQDTFAASIKNRIAASMAATDSPDTLSASAKNRVALTVAATDTRDTLSTSGYSIVTSRLSATDATDRFTASVQVIVSARLSATEASDVFLATSTPPNRSAIATLTEATDTFAASSYVVVRGSAAATDSPDTFAASVKNRITASMNATDAPDQLSASAKIRVAVNLAATDAQDSFVAPVKVRVAANMAATDSPDILSASASLQNLYITATVNATDAPDTFVASAQARVSVNTSFTDAQDVFAASTIVVPLSAPAAVVIQDGGSGGGSKRKPEYIRASKDFWEARERYLKSLQPELSEPEPEKVSPEISPIVEPELAPVTPDPQLLTTYRAERAEILTAIDLATSMRQLRAHGEHLRLINRRILEQKLLAARAEAASIRSEIETRRAIRSRRIKRTRRILATLEIAQALVRHYGSN